VSASPLPSPTDLPNGTNGALRGIGLKVASVICFVALWALLKAVEGMPAGQLSFFRSILSLPPILLFLALQGRISQAFETRSVLGQVLRGLIGTLSMGLNFFALTRLPLPEATALGYAAPIVVVMLSALLLKERVHITRWSAVTVGLLGVLIILWPRLTVFTSGGGDRDAAIGAIAALAGAVCAAFAMLQVRRLTQTERTEAIVVYFALTASVISLLTSPFGWIWPTPSQWLLLVGGGIAGGLGQMLLTASYRGNDMSVIAPFEYTSLLFSLAVGFFAFGDVPTPVMLLGSAVVIASGIAVILREHYLGLDRKKAREANTP
jgi:drug/metabolite transporter (DMT)-like permease